jgi:hypothetical protein
LNLIMTRTWRCSMVRRSTMINITRTISLVTTMTKNTWSSKKRIESNIDTTTSISVSSSSKMLIVPKDLPQNLRAHSRMSNSR